MIATSSRRAAPRSPAARYCSLCGARPAATTTEIDGRHMPACSWCLAPAGPVPPVAKIDAAVARRVRARMPPADVPGRLTADLAVELLATPRTAAQLAEAANVDYQVAGRVIANLARAGRVVRSSARALRAGVRSARLWQAVTP